MNWKYKFWGIPFVLGGIYYSYLFFNSIREFEIWGNEILNLLLGLVFFCFAGYFFFARIKNRKSPLFSNTLFALLVIFSLLKIAKAWVNHGFSNEFYWSIAGLLFAVSLVCGYRVLNTKESD